MATGQNSMGFKFTNDKTNLRDYNNLNIRIMKNYDISSVIIITNANNCLNFTPNADTSKSSYRIPAVTFSPYSTIKQILNINIDKVNTTYTINNLHIVPVYPYIGTTSQPTNYALAIEMNSYNSPLTDKLFIYVQIKHKTSSDKADDILDTLLYSDLSDQKNIILKQKYLDKLIPDDQQYYCQKFTDNNNISITNIFFDHTYIIYYTNQINLSTIFSDTENTYYTNANTNLKESIISTATCYKASKLSDNNSKFINYVDVDVISTTTNLENDIYIDCQPVEIKDSKEKDYLQVYSETSTTPENILTGTTYTLLIMFIVFISYGIYNFSRSFLTTLSKQTPQKNSTTASKISTTK